MSGGEEKRGEDVNIWGFTDLSDLFPLAACELYAQLAGGYIPGCGTHEIE